MCRINFYNYYLTLLVIFNGCKENVTSSVDNLKMEDVIHCYAPSSASVGRHHIKYRDNTSNRKGSNDDMVWINGGQFEMGAPDKMGLSNEYPRHTVIVGGFWMDATEVTNAEFLEFVDATGYVTTAEKPIDWEFIKQQLPQGTPKPSFDELQPGSMVFTPTSTVVALNDISKWWKWVPGANWRHPEGPGSTINGKENLPVVQISWEDVMAYCKWAGKRLPTEAEWEWAASSGGKYLYAWGNKHCFNTTANTWQGIFPYHNNKEDGFIGIAPVRSFAANEFGLFDMSGNVWEWCADWYDETYYQQLDRKISANPSGPATTGKQFLKVIRGGSYLCNPSYCEGYRRSRRMYSSFDSGTNHIGFRCVKD